MRQPGNSQQLVTDRRSDLIDTVAQLYMKSALSDVQVKRTK